MNNPNFVASNEKLLDEIESGISNQIDREISRDSNGKQVKNIFAKDAKKMFSNHDNEIIADKDFVADMIARFPKKSNETKNLETRDFVFKEYKVAKKTYDENFQIKTIYTPVLGVFEADADIFDEKNVLLTEKDFEATDYKLYEKYGTNPFKLISSPVGIIRFSKNSENNTPKYKELNIGDKIETGDQKLKSDLEFQLLNIRRLVETMNIDSSKIENYESFFVKNIQKPIFSDFYFSEMKGILNRLGEFGGLKNICQKAIETLEKIQNSQPKNIPQIDINFETAKPTQDLGFQLREIFGSKNIQSQDLEKDKIQLENIYNGLERLVEQIKSYQEKGYILVRNPGDRVSNLFPDHKTKICLIPEKYILDSKKLFFELKKSTESEKNLSDIEDFDIIEDIKSFPLLESTNFEFSKKDSEKSAAVEGKLEDLELNNAEKQTKKPDLVIGDFDDYGQNDLNINELEFDEKTTQPEILRIDSKISEISLMPQTQKPKKSSYRSLKNSALRLVDRYVHKETTLPQSVLGAGIKLGIDTKIGIEDFYSNMFFKSDYEKENLRRIKQIKKQQKESEKEVIEKLYSSSIWADKKTPGVDKNILKEGKRLLALWRRKMVSFSKNKSFHTDNLISFLNNNNLTFRDIGMTKAERKYILG